MNKNKVRLKGFKINNSVFINEKGLRASNNEKTASFDWGWESKGAQNLSIAILTKLKYEKIDEMFLEFAETFLYNLPANFHIELNFKKWKKWLKPPKDKAIIRTYLSLSSVVLSDNLVISKFIDFPYLDFKNAEFGKGTVEYRELFDIMYNHKLDDLNKYYSKATIRPDHNNMSASIKSSVYYDAMNDAFVYENGLGKLDKFTGHDLDKYEA